MPVSYYTEMRRINKLRLKELLEQNPDKTKKEIIGLMSLQTGLRPNTINKYYEELLELGLIQEKV